MLSIQFISSPKGLFIDPSGECKTRQISAVERSLYGINEHLEPIFNAGLCRMRGL